MTVALSCVTTVTCASSSVIIAAGAASTSCIIIEAGAFSTPCVGSIRTGGRFFLVFLRFTPQPSLLNLSPCNLVLLHPLAGCSLDISTLVPNFIIDLL